MYRVTFERGTGGKIVSYDLDEASTEIPGGFVAFSCNGKSYVYNSRFFICSEVLP